MNWPRELPSETIIDKILIKILPDHCLVLLGDIKQAVFNIVSNFVKPEELHKFLKRKS